MAAAATTAAPTDRTARRVGERLADVVVALIAFDIGPSFVVG
jgi:hypothetical protein